MPNNLVVTGASGVGKSTSLALAAESLNPRKISGFISPRQRDGDPTSGWLIEGFNGVSGLVADSSIKSKHRLGSFGVDLDLFDRCVLNEVDSLDATDLVMIDEVGIIGEWSTEFVRFLSRVLDSTVPSVLIVREKPGDLSDQVKSRSDVDLMVVTEQNRETAPGDIQRWVEDHDLRSR